MNYEFNYNDKIVNHLIKLENLKNSIEHLDLSTDTKYKLNINTKTNEIFFLANSLGIELTIKDSEKLITNIQIDKPEDERMQLIYNYKLVLEFNRSNHIDTQGEPDIHLLTKLNEIICNDVYSVMYTKIRAGNDDIITKLDNWIILRDKSISNDKVKKELENLIMWNKDISPYMNSLVRYLIFIFCLIEIAPFAAGNKFSLLALIDLLLLKSGFGSNIFISTNMTFLQNEDKIVQIFALAKTNNDISLWVQEVLNLIIKTINLTIENLQSIIIEEEKTKNQPFLDLNKRQLKILRYLQNVPNIKREDYCHMMEVSPMTAFRDLDDLVRKKLLKVEGKGRGTKYRLASY